MDNPIVFIHGSGDSARIWRYQVEQLGAEKALAIDLPGHGLRPDHLPAEVTVLDYAKAVYQIIEDELQLVHPIIAGHSLGGAIALTMALEYKEKLGGLILIGTGSRLRVHPDLLSAAQKMPQLAQQQLAHLSVAQVNSETIPQAIASEQITAGPDMLYRDLAACNVFDVMTRLYEIQLATLIICGTDDRLTPLKYSQYLHEHIAGSTLSIIPGAGHYVMREQPVAVTQAIENWLDLR